MNEKVPSHNVGVVTLITLVHALTLILFRMHALSVIIYYVRLFSTEVAVKAFVRPTGGRDSQIHDGIYVLE
jgi:hypothetical protein